MPPAARAHAAAPCMVAFLVALAACSGSPDPSPPVSGSASPAASTEAPALDVQVVVGGLDHPWDVAQAPDGTLLLDERGGGFTVVLTDGTVRSLEASFDDLFATGETGLMGLTLDPDFAANRRFYTCQGVQEPGGAEIQVIAWTVDERWSAATRVADPLLGGIPVNRRTGRHGGCRPRFDPSGALLIGTGDNTVGSNPQDLGTLAGKVLRIDPQTGGPVADNPFIDATDPVTRLVYSYGHRNVQGIAVQPGTGQVFTVEQGTTRDDEVNLSVAGGNYGYDPDGPPEGPDGAYDESVPMTDPAIPGAIPAVWSSGTPTIATCGGTFLTGAQWGGYDGVLLVGVQKDTGVLGLRIDAGGRLQEQFRIPELEDTYGRVRSPVQGNDGALYLTTDNGDGADRLLKVTPR
jgi:aldose sugar dehydrogenase